MANSHAWREVRLSEVLTRSFSGPSPTCQERTVRGEEWGVLKTTCTTWERGWDQTKHKVLPESFWGKRHLQVRSGDTIITKAGPRHRVAVPAFVASVRPRIIPSGKMICLRPDARRIEPGFLTLALMDPRTQTHLDQRTTGMAESQVNFENKDLLGAPLWLPSLEIQQQILGTLAGADMLITSLERLITKKRLIKQGLMQQLLAGTTRLPGFTERWSEVSVFDLANNQRSLFNDGDWVESEHISASGNRLLQTGNVGVGRLLNRGTKRYVSDDSFSTLKCKEVHPGDVLICRLAEPAGRACLVEDIGERRMLTSVDVTIFRPDEAKADRRFLVAAFSTPRWFDEVNERCGGSTRTRIARSQLGSIKLHVPGLIEQTAIADVLTDADAELEALTGRLTKARAIKTGMMQHLLTGRTRLPIGAAP